MRLTRRSFLDTANTVNPSVPSWSYLSSYDYGTPVLGTFHGSDILQVFFGVLPNYASAAFKSYYLSFVNSLDPNSGLAGTIAPWPRWSTTRQLLNMYPSNSILINDSFRQNIANYLTANANQFYIRR